MTIPMQNDLIKHTTISQMVAEYRQAVVDIREADRLFQGATSSLKQTIGGNNPRSEYHFSIGYDYQGRRRRSVDEMLEGVKREAWRIIIDRMEIRRAMSVKRCEQLDKWLDNEELPEITEETIWEQMEAAAVNINTMVNEAVAEVFEFLRPRNSHLKTNTEFEIGKKVILGYAVERRWNGGFTWNHYRRDQLRALDNVFHVIDGQGIAKSYNGPLLDAIHATTAEGTGETDYFKFRCCKNGNLHLEFKRLDLVARLNAIAGGNRLKGGSAR